MGEFFPLIADDIRQAAADMSRDELGISNALAGLCRDVDAAIAFLDLIRDKSKPDYDAGHALVAGEVSRLLAEAAAQAVGTHSLMTLRRSTRRVH